MGNIHVLSFEIANLIAAGEVVERPSSVLKELLENAIDAKATNIVAEIKRGGVSLIRVSDNGCGIGREDLPVALKRHATSKITDADDLSHIMTLGFRGEALAAISSVSKMTIITKRKEDETGSMLTSEAGIVADVEEVGAADGTTVVVEDLFYNVPARRKFLKKDVTEAMNVTALVEKVALSSPSVSIQLLVDGEEKFRTPGNGDLSDTVYSVLGRDFASKTIPVDGTANGIRVHGFIGRSDNARKNRNMENIFINGRFVKSLTIGAAVEKAYVSYIAPECFPTCVLFVEINPAVVDVNVHPAKLEVKFTDERPVFEIVYYTVREALIKGGYRPDFQIERRPQNPLQTFVPIGEKTAGEQIPIKERNVGFPKERLFDTQRERASVTNGSLRVASAPAYRDDKSSMTARESLSVLQRYHEAKPEVPVRENTVTETETKNLPDYRIVGEAFNCYVIVETADELYLIDKHAAHERVIFEDLKKSREKDGRVASQMLLLPFTVLLTPDEVGAVLAWKDSFESVGFTFDVSEKGATVSAVPDCIAVTDAESLFMDMTSSAVSAIGDPALTDAIRRERALYQIACKAAIKGGRVYDAAVIRWLVEKLLSIPDITVCPHGRPVAYRLTKRDLDKQFDRIK